MARPYIRRALRRAGVALGPPEAAEPSAAPRIPPPRIFLPGEAEDAGPVDLVSLFGRAAPVELEIGTGKGRFLLESAAAHPERSWLGLEIETEYCVLARLRAARRGLSNVRIEPLDGREFVIRRVAPASLAGLHVYFPDPWPKRRHQKRRIFRPELLALARRALVPGGELRVATDHAEYGEAIRRLLAEHAHLFTPLPWPADEGAPLPTNYALKWQRLGRPLWWARYAARTGD